MAQPQTKKKSKLAAKLKRREDSSIALGQALHSLGGTGLSHQAPDPTDLEQAPEQNPDPQEPTI